jgi:hypothetical protein
MLLQLWSRWAEVVVIVKSKTVVGLPSRGLSLALAFRPHGGRPKRIEAAN